MVTVKKNQPATIQSTNKSVRDAPKLSKLRCSAESNTPVSLLWLQSLCLRNFEGLHTKGRLGCIWTSLLFRFVVQYHFFGSHMGRGYQLVGVWPEHSASAKIKTTNISSEDFGRFSERLHPWKFLLYAVMNLCNPSWPRSMLSHAITRVLVSLVSDPSLHFWVSSYVCNNEL